MTDVSTLPEIDSYLIYLDAVRDTGKINMFCASPYLAKEFDLPKNQARYILLYWMNTYSERHPE